jgi:hypothetical protein
MKSNGKSATKTTANRIGNLKPVSRKATKTASAKRPAKKSARKNGGKRQTVKSTVPPQFRVLRRMDPKDPRYWELRDRFREYYKSLPEEEIEPFLEGLKRPFLDYLFVDLARHQYETEGFFSVWKWDWL